MNATASPRAFAVFPVVLLTACSASPEPLPGIDRPDAGSADLSTDAGPPPVAECAIALRGPARASAGGRVRLELDTSAEATLSFGLPADARVTVDGRTATVRLGYGSVGSLTVSAHARCGEQEASAEHVVQVEMPV